MTNDTISFMMDDVQSQFIDFERVCRLCMQEKRIFVDIFESTNEGHNVDICQKIKACAMINVYRGDGLPTRVCVPCLSSLNAAYDFRIQCENADKSLRDIYNLIICDQAMKEKTPMAVSDNKQLEAESKELKTKQLHFSDLDHLIVIERQEAEVTQEKELDYVSNVINNGSYKEEREKETENLFFLVTGLKENKNLSDVSTDKLKNINEEAIVSCDSSDVLPLQTMELKKSDQLFFSLEGNNFLKSSKQIQNSFIKKRKILTNSLEEKIGKRKINDVKKSACPFCQKMLTRVNEHIRLLHQNKIYICKKNECKAEFLTLKNLQSHQLKCYNMEKQYKCLRCFKEFYRKCNYKAHIIRHSDKKNFQCQLCDKAFVDSTGLKRHFSKHHEPEQETFISGCCSKKFKTKEGLKQHIQKGICGVQVFQILDSTHEIV